jgi:flagellar hook-associated protein 1 FlgK
MFTYDPAAPAGTLRVSAALQDSPELLAAAGIVGGAPGDVTNAQNLLSLRQAKLFSGGTQTVEETYRQVLASMGRETQRATDARDARQQLVDSLDTQYAEQAGVSLDEEAVEIMRYQQVYDAAIRLVKIADTMMQEILGLAE